MGSTVHLAGSVETTVSVILQKHNQITFLCDFGQKRMNWKPECVPYSVVFVWHTESFKQEYTCRICYAWTFTVTVKEMSLKPIMRMSLYLCPLPSVKHFAVNLSVQRASWINFNFIFTCRDSQQASPKTRFSTKKPFHQDWQFDWGFTGIISLSINSISLFRFFIWFNLLLIRGSSNCWECKHPAHQTYFLIKSVFMSFSLHKVASQFVQGALYCK